MTALRPQVPRMCLSLGLGPSVRPKCETAAPTLEEMLAREADAK